MIDILLRFPSREAAAQIGMALGYTTQDPETGDYQTTQATLDLAVCIIGEHFAPNGETTEGPNGESVPVLVGDGQYWVMVRSLVDMEIPPEVQPFVVERNPDDPTIPNQAWA
jgi:hypothetical protein